MTFGSIDVLVNNAGYIEAGMVEEASHEQYLAQFNTNVFGVINLTQAVLPHFRENKSGFVVFIGSSEGWSGDLGAGPYCGSKFALEGVYECLKLETASLGIKSIIFELGFFRTKVFHPDNIKGQPSHTEDYATLAQMVSQFVQIQNGNQEGDPKKAVSIMIDVVKGEGVAEGKETPARLPLGPDMLGVMRKKCNDILKICDEWEEISGSTNLDA